MQITINDNTHVNEFYENKELTEIIINCNAIAPFSFANCTNIKNIICNNPNTKFLWNSFTNCKNLESIRLPENISEIPDECFEDCVSLKSITIPHLIKTIGCNAFYNTNLSDGIVFNNEQIVNISPNAFAMTRLKELNLNSKMIISALTFANNEYLEVINFGKQMPFCSMEAFIMCGNIKEIYLPLFCNENSKMPKFNENIKYYIDCDKDEYLSNLVLEKFGVKKVIYLKSLDCLLEQGKSLKEISKLMYT